MMISQTFCASIIRTEGPFWEVSGRGSAFKCVRNGVKGLGLGIWGSGSTVWSVVRIRVTLLQAYTVGYEGSKWASHYPRPNAMKGDLLLGRVLQTPEV